MLYRLRTLLPRHSLATLMLGITALGVLLGAWLSRSERQRRAVVALRVIDRCEIAYDFDAPPGCQRVSRPLGSTYKPNWLGTLLSVDHFRSVIDITIPTENLDAALPYLNELPSLRAVYIYTNIGNSDDDTKQLLEAAESTLKHALPHVLVEEAISCPITISTIPVVG